MEFKKLTPKCLKITLTLQSLRAVFVHSMHWMQLRELCISSCDLDTFTSVCECVCVFGWMCVCVYVRALAMRLYGLDECTKGFDRGKKSRLLLGEFSFSFLGEHGGFFFVDGGFVFLSLIFLIWYELQVSENVGLCNVCK